MYPGSPTIKTPAPLITGAVSPALVTTRNAKNPSLPNVNIRRSDIITASMPVVLNSPSQKRWQTRSNSTVLERSEQERFRSQIISNRQLHVLRKHKEHSTSPTIMEGMPEIDTIKSKAKQS